MIVAVVGTGTEIGKTHVACALIGALVDRGVRAIGWKPVESGVVGGIGSDEALLARASGTAAAAPTIRLRAAVSPHLAARLEDARIDPGALRDHLVALAATCEVVVVELAGGLFSPLTDELDNADWLAGLGVDPRLVLVLVAPDRLGVLHDIAATTRAARALGLDCSTIALVAAAAPDASSGTNAAELRHRLPMTVHEIPRAPIDELRSHPTTIALATALTSETTAPRSRA